MFSIISKAYRKTDFEFLVFYWINLNYCPTVMRSNINRDVKLDRHFTRQVFKNIVKGGEIFFDVNSKCIFPPKNLFPY